MKKIIFIIIMMFAGIYSLNASCTYSEKRELNALSSYVNYDYDYNDNSFSVNIYNLKNNLIANYNGTLAKDNYESRIIGLTEGESLKVSITAGEGTCEGEALRVITINIPYLNPYYGSEECEGKEDLNVCSSKFLDYRLSESTFNSLVNKRVVTQIKDEEEAEEEVVTLLDRVMEIVEKAYIPLILVIISSIITYMILKPIYRKIKHGL